MWSKSTPLLKRQDANPQAIASLEDRVADLERELASLAELVV
jgi:hypothetical protein